MVRWSCGGNATACSRWSRYDGVSFGTFRAIHGPKMYSVWCVMTNDVGPECWQSFRGLCLSTASGLLVGSGVILHELITDISKVIQYLCGSPYHVT